MSQEIESHRPAFIWNTNANSVPFCVDQLYGIRIIRNPRYQRYAFPFQLLGRTISTTHNLTSRNFLAPFRILHIHAHAHQILKSLCRRVFLSRLSQPTSLQFRPNLQNARVTQVVNIDENFGTQLECKYQGCDKRLVAYKSSIFFSVFSKILNLRNMTVRILRCSRL